ncbi:MAG: hypothetical protein KDD56_07210 [Bdellovibrionales bacterium]|nr:hypothetical protein [Bdellovibrionales bacterium]
MLLFLSFPTFAETRTSQLVAEDDPRGEPELTICSQNLQNFGTYAVYSSRLGGDQDDYKSKLRDLVQRFAKTKCDLIAVQELVGRGSEETEKGIKTLASAMAAITGRVWNFEVGPSNDPVSKVAYLIAADRGKIINSISYSRVELPKLNEKQKPRRFVRGPFEIQVQVNGRGGSNSKIVNLITFHFKSKRSGTGDPADLEWETYRMEMAEALRRVVESRHADSFSSGSTILVLLGDRNSNFDSASAKILEGTLKLSHFQGTAPCRLGTRGVPFCQAKSSDPQKLFSVLTEDPQTKYKVGTYKYKGVYSWLDDILLPAESLPFAWQNYANEGDYDSGVHYLPAGGSDHALAWVRLNWQ